MVEKLFIKDITPCDELYRIIRDENRPSVVELKCYMEKLWGTYYPYADKDFKKQLAQDFDARFWEMYLTCTLVHKSYEVVPKQGRARGPDIKIENASANIWIEAVTPTSGESRKPDSVRTPRMGVAEEIPDEQITLRYRSAIHDKYFDKYFKYVESRIIRREDCYIIALNSCRIPWAGHGDYEPPRIVRSVLPFGWEVVTVSTSSHTAVKSGNQYRPHLRKASGDKVDTDIFLKTEYSHISAVMSSHVNVANTTSGMGDDFIIVNNPLASKKLPEDFPRVGRKYEVNLSDNKVKVFPRNLGQN